MILFPRTRILFWLIVPIVCLSCATSVVFEEQKRALVAAPNAVYGRVVDKIDLYETYTPYRTKYVFEIEESIKGSTHSDTIYLFNRSGKTSDNAIVSVTFEWGFNIGDEAILIMHPLKKSKNSFHRKLNEMYEGKTKVNFSAKDQFIVRERIVFEDDKSKYTKPKMSPEKMIRLKKDYLNDPNKKVPEAQIKI